MALTPDQIIDRINLKRQVVNWRLVAIVFLILLALSLFTNKEFKQVSPLDGDYIARINIQGSISNNLVRIDNMKKIAQNKNIKGVIIHVDSPGGTVVGGENLYMAIRKISKNKPVAIVMGDSAASAAYMLSLGGDYLVAYEGTMTGSIGVIAQTFEVTKLADTLGVKFYNFKSSPLKGGPSPTEHMTPEMEQSIDGMIKDIYDSFVSLVAERRNIPLEVLLPLADGRTYTGRQALSLGLIDALGDEDTAFDWIVANKKLNPNISLRDYDIEPHQSKFDKFLETATNISYALKAMFNNNLTYYS
jgi:protease-4